MRSFLYRYVTILSHISNALISCLFSVLCLYETAVANGEYIWALTHFLASRCKHVKCLDCTLFDYPDL